MLAGSERVEVAAKDVKCKCMILFLELRLYPVEKTTQLTRALSLAPLGKPRAQVKNEHAWITGSE